MGPLLVTFKSLLVIVNYGKVAQAACPAGCICTSFFINCCESERYLEIPIRGFDNTTRLSLSGCPHLVIAKQSIWTLKSLEDISITRTPVSYLDAYAFSDLPKLKNLVLSELNLSAENTHPSAFTDLPIQQLDLKNNNFKIIHSQMFSGLKNLRSLDLSRNKIVVIQNQAFESLAVLLTLNLDYNNFSSVTPFWFKPSSNYSSLHISILGNSLTNKCRFRGFDLPENRWFKMSLWPNDSITPMTADLPVCSLPLFTNNYDEIYVTESSFVTLTCSAVGIPKPTLIWLLPTGSEVLPTTIPFSVADGKLKWPNAKLSDSGIYACVASNSEGSSVALTRFSVFPNTTMAMAPEYLVTETPKKKDSFTLFIVLIILLFLVLVFVVSYISRLIYRLAKKPNNDNFEFSRFVDTPNILPVPENPQPMPHV
ncbi:leucine-rich repeat and fibronectin type III domain-containing protein 1-like protein [Mantella aurantiaca]